MEKNRGRKGQMFSAELVVASSLFIVAIVLFVLMWNGMRASYVAEEADYEMQSTLVSVSDTLVLSPGEPSGWEGAELENASQFGLAESQNSLVAGKLSALQALNATQYYKVKEGMGAGKFDVYISLSNSTGTLLGDYPLYAFGIAPNASDPSIRAASLQRLASLNGTPVTLTVQLWRTARGS
ncbi:Uncharacterised protein [uncultured archaeon]|nr:Uncharacterised protein [uncultured archaeon]